MSNGNRRVANGHIAGLAVEVLRESLADSWGSISPAVYDTAQVVALPSRFRPPGVIEWLLRTQEADGGWAAYAPPPYRLLPALAAVRALVAVSCTRPHPMPIGLLGNAALRGLRYLVSIAGIARPSALPDTVAVEMIVPAQFELLRSELESAAFVVDCRHRTELAAAEEALTPWHHGLSALRNRAATGGILPPHILHTVEVLGPALAARVAGFQDSGPVGCSPAATAAVIAGSPRASADARNYLDVLAGRHDGGLPDLAPITTFEQVWIGAQLLTAGIALPSDLTKQFKARLSRLLQQGGVGMAPGFPVDCDITASVLAIGARLGLPLAASYLDAFLGESAFFCYYSGERTLSPTVNAHALDALDSLSDLGCYPDARQRAARFLLDSQQEDGTWADKWHASPYYNAWCCVPPLRRYATADASEGVGRSRRWLLETQRSDGSWGVWDPTLEETAYAVSTILESNEATAAELVAARRGLHYLTDAFTAPAHDSFPPLWHGKELFAPARIIRATILATLWRGACDLRLSSCSRKPVRTRMFRASSQAE